MAYSGAGRALRAGLIVALSLTGYGAAAGAATRGTPPLPRGAPPLPRGALGVHSMLYSDTPPAFKRDMFREAVAMGATETRVDVDLTAIYQAPGAPPDFSTVDQYISLAAQFHLRVLADVTAMPGWLAECQTRAQSSQYWLCGTDQAQAFADMIGAVARHARGLINDYEVINEPDSGSTWFGTPSQYAWMLADAYRAVHSADPGARVAIGGVTGGPSARAWLEQVFAAPGAGAAHAFDIANVHLRDRASRLAGDLRSWKRFFAGYGFAGPLWVTEHGYPSEPAYQYDPAYRGSDAAGGLAEQARFLSVSVPRLVGAGAATVFVTERDNLSGAFASEGVLSGEVSDPVADQAAYRVVVKPALAALRALVSGLDAAAVHHPGLAADRGRGL